MSMTGAAGIMAMPQSTRSMARLMMRCMGVRPVPFTMSSGVSNSVLFFAPRSMMSVSLGAT